MPRLSKIGAAALGAFGWTSGAASVSASYLQVAGGGGGGSSIGSGGGAGGLLSGTVFLNPTLSYTVTVGAGGAGGAYGTTTSGATGSNSQFGTLTASVGGGAGVYQTVGGTGGSGGGGGQTVSSGGGLGTAGQGNNGGSGAGGNAGGGGGAGAVGTTSTNSVGGAGGNGTASSISGTSVTYAGGGGGGGFSTFPSGAGGTGGGGAGAVSTNATSGTANLGGGGGGGGYVNTPSVISYAGGNGGSGVVIISYLGAQQFGGGVVTSSGGYTIHTFNTSGTLAPISSLSASYLIVGGGGSGGWDRGGGGGAGGYLTGSGLTIDTNSNYVVTVGAGGASSTSTGVRNSGSNSSFSAYATASVGGGAGGSGSNANGLTGGSGGGAFYGGSVGAGTSGQGYAGGLGDTTYFSVGGGGGGASQVGYPATNTPPYTGPNQSGGNGGNGLANSISGTSTYYAGGGGGGVDYRDSGVAGTGGLGGGGNAIKTQGGAGSAGTANTGGGGGAGGEGATGYGGAGGSGIVIISYAGSTQQMAGGTVTISGGNVIHTFTSSGYLTPLKLVPNSLRFRSSASAYLNRTPSVQGSLTTWTYSAWVKRGSLGVDRNLLMSRNAAQNYTGIFFDTSDKLWLDWFVSGSAKARVQTAQVFRDPAAWYHIVVTIDSSNATAANRVLMYVNGTQITSFTLQTLPAQNDQTIINQTIAHWISSDPAYPAQGYFDGYMTEVNFIDGQALTPNSFGTFNSYGVWQPITYGGSYGTNGFYLPFTNKTSTTTLGYDFSPAGNNWTTNNISLTAGSTYDSMTDVPTLTSATVANYATFNPVIPSNFTLSNGNLNVAGTSEVGAAISTIGMSSGKWYWESTGLTGSNGNHAFGICNSTALGKSEPNGTAGFWVTNGINGNKYANGGAGAAYMSSYTNNDVIGIAFDADAGTVVYYKNGVSQGTAFTGLTSGPYFAINGYESTVSFTNCINFGQRGFAYTPPANYLALNTYNI